MSGTGSTESEVILTINRNNLNLSKSNESEVCEEEISNNPQESESISNESSNIILCVIWKCGKMGASYYNLDEKLLYVYEEMIDSPPQFLISHSLFRELCPKFILSFGSIGDEFVNALIDIITNGGDTTVTSDGLRVLPPNFYLLQIKEYTYELCKTVLSQLSVASNTIETSETKTELYIQSLINFDSKMTVYAAGALIKYLDKNWAYFGTNKDELQFLHIHQTSMKNHVLIDWSSFKALQIFQQLSHEASFKRGLHSSSREGLSIFKLLSSNCKSKLGQLCLKNILLNPTTNISELNKRLDFISFVLQPNHQDFVESLQDNIKYLADVNLILGKIQNSRAVSRDWSVLYKSLYNIVFMNELSSPYRGKSQLIDDLNKTVSADLIGLEQTINNALDFSIKNANRRPVIKFGLDESLDAKKLRRQDITRHLTAAAKVAVDELPSFLNECAIVYLPEMGHLIAIKEWAEDCNPEELTELGFQFVFTLRGTIHYRNPLCLELDKCIGDINSEIIAHENRILHRLSGFVLKYNKDIRKALGILALMDCLISMGKAAVQNSYIRPTLNDQSIHEIDSCRHPLMELVSIFESNNFYSGGSHSHIKVITGPNGSGKSIYLKQVALIVYLAHVGSYVPAKKANIGMVYSIHTRMQGTESVAVRLSAFMIDIIQTTQALHNAKFSSLILLDEFGKGTTGDEGLGLLVGALKKFNSQKEFCPHVLVSTHFQQVANYLPQSKIVDHLKMDYTKQDGALLFLYKIIQGVSESFALDIAAEVGLDENVVGRAREILGRMKKGEMIEPLGGNNKFRNFTIEEEIEFLQDIDIPEPDDDQ